MSRQLKGAIEYSDHLSKIAVQASLELEQVKEQANAKEKEYQDTIIKQEQIKSKIHEADFENPENVTEEDLLTINQKLEEIESELEGIYISQIASQPLADDAQKKYDIAQLEVNRITRDEALTAKESIENELSKISLEIEDLSSQIENDKKTLIRLDEVKAFYTSRLVEAQYLEIEKRIAFDLLFRKDENSSQWIDAKNEWTFASAKVHSLKEYLETIPQVYDQKNTSIENSIADKVMKLDQLKNKKSELAILEYDYKLTEKNYIKQSAIGELNELEASLRIEKSETSQKLDDLRNKAESKTDAANSILSQIVDFQNKSTIDYSGQTILEFPDLDFSKESLETDTLGKTQETEVDIVIPKYSVDENESFKNYRENTVEYQYGELSYDRSVTPDAPEVELPQISVPSIIFPEIAAPDMDQFDLYTGSLTFDYKLEIKFDLSQGWATTLRELGSDFIGFESGLGKASKIGSLYTKGAVNAEESGNQNLIGYKGETQATGDAGFTSGSVSNNSQNLSEEMGGSYHYQEVDANFASTEYNWITDSESSKRYLENLESEPNKEETTTIAIPDIIIREIKIPKPSISTDGFEMLNQRLGNLANNWVNDSYPDNNILDEDSLEEIKVSDIKNDFEDSDSMSIVNQVDTSDADLKGNQTSSSNNDLELNDETEKEKLESEEKENESLQDVESKEADKDLYIADANAETDLSGDKNYSDATKEADVAKLEGEEELAEAQGNYKTAQEDLSNQSDQAMNSFTSEIKEYSNQEIDFEIDASLQDIESINSNDPQKENDYYTLSGYTFSFPEWSLSPFMGLDFFSRLPDFLKKTSDQITTSDEKQGSLLGDYIMAIGQENYAVSSDFGDTILAVGRENLLIFHKGNDKIVVAGSSNAVSTVAGNNTVLSMGEANKLVAGTGGDLFLVGGLENEVKFNASGQLATIMIGDKNKLSGPSIGLGGSVFAIAMGNKNKLAGISGGGDTLVAKGTENELKASNGDDTLLAYGWNNTVEAGKGADFIVVVGFNNNVTADKDAVDNDGIPSLVSEQRIISMVVEAMMLFSQWEWGIKLLKVKEMILSIPVGLFLQHHWEVEMILRLVTGLDPSFLAGWEMT